MSHAKRGARTSRRKPRTPSNGRRSQTQPQPFDAAPPAIHPVKAAIQQSERRFRSLVLATSQIFWTTDALGRVRGQLPSWQRFTGQSGAEIQGSGWARALHPDDLERTLKVWNRAIQSKSLYDTEYRVRRHDGVYRYFAVRGVPVLRGNKILEWVGACTDITERKQAEVELQKTYRVLQAVSACNQAVIRASREAELLATVCRIVVDICGYRFAFAGFKEHDEFKSVRPVARAGDEQGYLQSVRICWADNERGRGPTGTAIREQRICVAQNILSDPAMLPWRPEALKRGFASSIALPLTVGSQTVGALSIYSERPDSFDKPERDLLAALAADLSFGIQSLRAAAERERAEGVAEAERRQFYDVLEALPAYVALLTPDYHVPFANRVFRERFGESQGRRCYEFLFNRTEPCEICETYTVLKTRAPHEWEWTGPDNRNYQIFDLPFTAADGSPFILEMGVDVTARQHAEEALRFSEARLTEAQRIAHLGNWDWNILTNELWWSDEIYRIFGLAPHEFGATYDAFLQRIHPEDRTLVERAVRLALDEKMPYSIDHRIVLPDGSERSVHEQGQVFRDESGRPIRMSGSVHDITERKRAEEQLRGMSLYARSLIEASLDPLVTISAEGKIMDVNQATEQVTGVPRNQLLGSDFSNYFTEPEKARVGYQKVFSQGFVTDYPLTIRHVSGRITDVLYNATVFKNEAGQVQGVFAAARDITERKRAEEQLRGISLYARSLIEASLDPLVTISAEGKIMDVNAATEQVTGVPRNQLLGSDFSNYFTEPEKARAGYQQVFSQGFVRDYPLSIRHATGQVSDVLYNATVFKNETGQVQGVFAAARDITERKRAEEEIRRLNEGLEHRVRERTAELSAANKELEAFTYAVAHDLRAPLRHIQGFSGLLREECAGQLKPEAQEFLSQICQSTERMSHLLEDLLNLSRIGRQPLHTQICGLNALVDEVIAGLKAETQDRQIEWRIGHLPFVACDAGLLRQVFANLLSNAIKFSRPRSPAVIEVGEAAKDGQPCIFVRDNGVGFDMQFAGKLFGVFQRLHRREDFEGTGVGLATVQRIIQKHGGRVWADAELDKGATFFFSLGAPQIDIPAAPHLVLEGESPCLVKK